MATSEGDAVVELLIPGKPEYVGVARLAILGVAGRMRFSYDEVEDIRLAVGEACTTAIERAGAQPAAAPQIRLRCFVDPTRLVIEVSDNIAPAAGSEPAELSEAEQEQRSLGGVLIRILMDDVQSSREPETGWNVVRMTKYVANAAR